MGKVYESIDEKIEQFILNQKMFFVGTAPSSADGHVNVSPKGLDSFRILDDHTVVYADLAGSGIETVAHVRENARIVLMFCAFEGAPNIVRLHGRGEVVEQGHADFDSMRALFGTLTGLRSFIRVNCTRISDSCGYGVPLFEFKQHRTQLVGWSTKKGAAGLKQYLLEHNRHSIDGSTGIEVGDDDA